tara:strand:+ start:577 stop:864 length:288 start_codon:yes stop_codon:yes gene_type:complete
MDNEQLQHELREAREELDRVMDLYRKLCANPFFWFIRPLDDRIEDRTLMHCNCGGYFWLDGEAEGTKHRGHLYRRAIETSVWTYFKARYWPSRIK